MPKALLIAFVCHVLLAGFCLMRTPALEAPGEAARVREAVAVAQGHAPGTPYAAVLGVTLRVLGTTDLEPIERAAPTPGALRYLHGADEPAGSVEQRALWVLRLWSVLFGLVTLALTYGLARTAFATEPEVATVTVLLLACVPQWAFSHGTLWAGSLTAVATHVAFLLAVRGARRGRFTALEGPGLGLAILLASLADAHTWFVPAIAGFAVITTRATRPFAAAAWVLGAFLLGRGLAPTAITVPAGGRGVLALLVSFVGEFGDAAVPAPWLPCIGTVVVVALAALGVFVGPIRLAAQHKGVAVVFFSCSLGTMALYAAGVADGMSGRAFLLAAGPMFVVTAVGLLGFWRWLMPRRAPWPLALGAWLPFLPCATVLWMAYVPALDPAHARATASGFAAIQGNLREGIARGIDLLQPADAAVVDAPPTFEWQAAPRAAGFVLTAWSDDGRVLVTSFDAQGNVPTASAWTLPADTFAALPLGTEVHWRVRALADRSHCEASAAMRGSAVRTFVVTSASPPR